MNNKLFFTLEKTLVDTTLNEEVDCDLIVPFGRKMKAYTNVRESSNCAIDRAVRSIGMFDVYLITDSYKEHVENLCKQAKFNFYERNIICDVKKITDLGDSINESNNYLISSEDFNPSSKKCKLLGIKDITSYIKVEPYTRDSDFDFLDAVVKAISLIKSDPYEY
jgi:hypothetical protein